MGGKYQVTPGLRLARRRGHRGPASPPRAVAGRTGVRGDGTRGQPHGGGDWGASAYIPMDESPDHKPVVSIMKTRSPSLKGNVGALVGG